MATERDAWGPDEALVVAVGDIHGRFDRVQRWLATLERALGHRADAVFAVGDVEAYKDPEAHRERAARRAMKPEFPAYATGAAALHRPLYFIGGNNEDFDALHAMPQGGELVAGAVHYLGRHGVREVAGLRVAYLSGIYAPRFYDATLAKPAGEATRKQAGYFRHAEVSALAKAVEQSGPVDLMLVHEWPRGLVRPVKDVPGGRVMRVQRMPWIGNPVTRTLVERVRPTWLLCGHSHIALSATIEHAGPVAKGKKRAEQATRVACLDQAARPEGAVLWLAWKRGVGAVRAGWGVTGEVAWREGEAWDESRTPVGPAA